MKQDKIALVGVLHVLNKFLKDDGTGRSKARLIFDIRDVLRIAKYPQREINKLMDMVAEDVVD